MGGVLPGTLCLSMPEEAWLEAELWILAPQLCIALVYCCGCCDAWLLLPVDMDQVRSDSQWVC